MLVRRTHDCPFRQVVRTERGTEVADCRLVQDIVSEAGSGLCAVGRDACDACCGMPIPSRQQINPVIASVLSRATEQIIGQGSKPGCNLERAEELRDWARANLDVEARGVLLSPTRYGRDSPCYFLGDECSRPDESVGQTVHHCQHPAHGRTTADSCHWCRHWVDGPRPAPLPLSQLVPFSFPRSGPLIRKWAVGVTTAPRRWPTVDDSLDSLIRAGWEQPWLFMDSEVTVAPRFSRLPRTVRDTAVGAWPNFYLSLLELLMREPDVDAYMLVEDDVIFYDRQNLCEYLEQVLWLSGPPGIVSLYCPSACAQDEPGWHDCDGPWVWGALAFIFPREVAKAIVANGDVLEHRWRQGIGLANIDSVIGHWAARENVPVHYPWPSLVQHIGSASTLWDTDCILGNRRAAQFLGDLA